MITVNFFWRGDNFSYLNRLTVLSHINVGHSCVMWLSGKRPNSPFWIEDLDVTIQDADIIHDVTSFLNRGGNMKTASDLWRFYFLYERGGLYCDVDALAVKHFPQDEWILVSSFKEHPKEQLSIGVIAAPKGESVFLECINKIEHKWGNVTLFADEYKKIKGNANSTHDDKLFYPFTWKQWNMLFEDIPIPDGYSIHLYHTMLERNDKILSKEQYSSNTLIGRLIEKFGD